MKVSGMRKGQIQIVAPGEGVNEASPRRLRKGIELEGELKKREKKRIFSQKIRKKTTKKNKTKNKNN